MLGDDDNYVPPANIPEKSEEQLNRYRITYSLFPIRTLVPSHEPDHDPLPYRLTMTLYPTSNSIEMAVKSNSLFVPLSDAQKLDG